MLTDIVSVVIEGGFKVGRFTIGFRDVDWPLKGIPAQVNRVYDSTHKCPGDFGYGWDLADVRVQISAQLGEWWDLEETQFCLPLQGDPIYPPFSLCNGTPQPLWCVQHTRPHYVTVTLPDGKTEIFDLIMDVEEERECMRFFVPDGAIPTFKPRPGTTSQLRVNTGAVFFRQLQDGQGNNRWTFVDSSFEPWDPQQFELETEDGIIYQIHRTEGVKSITDLEGNSVTINTNGITHSSGETIGFTRNAKGFITQVNDPANNVTTYAYNDADDLVAVTDPEGNTVRFRYDGFHNLIEVQDPTDNIPARNEYDTDGRLVAQVDGHGNRISFDHDIAGRQELVTDAAGNLTVHVYDERGNILQTTNALGETTLYTYDAFDNELTKTIAAGTPVEATTTRTYDDKNRVLSETDPLGHTVSYSYDGKGNPLSIGDSVDQTVDFTYDNFGRPNSITDPLGEIVTTSYFIENNRLVSLTTDPLGHVTHTEEDFRGHTVRELDVRGNETLYTNDIRGNVTTQTAYRTDQSGVAQTLNWARTYDRNGRQLSETNPLGHTTSTVFDGNGRVTTETDARGNSISYTYDAPGNKVQTLFPDGTIETATWDERGNLLTSTDRQGRTTRFSYDVENRLTRTDYPDGTETSQTYDAAGRVATVSDARGNTTSYEYDLAGRRTKVTDAFGSETIYVYDARGNQTSVIDANGHTTTFVYDAKNRRTETLFHDGTRQQVFFDDLDRQTETIDQAGLSTHFSYDAAGNLTEVTDTLGQKTNYAYDEQGNRTEQTDALGRTTRWGYDNGNRPVSRTLPIGMTETMAYDALGNLITHTDFKGQVATFSYDALNRLLTRTDTDGMTSRSYHPSGLRATATDTRGTTTYTYDLSYRLIRVDNPEGSWLSYEYDANGNRTALVGPNQSTSYSFDALNRLATVTDETGTTSYGYDAVGNLTSLAQANGVISAYAYDTLNRLSHQETRKSDSNLIKSYDYTLAPTGQRTRVVELDGRQVDYTYDDLYRLTEEAITDAARGNQTIGYTLDAVGNRLTKTDASGAIAYSYDANDRLQTAGTDSFTYDANGNTITATKVGVATTYAYDAQNRLTEAVTGGSIAAFAYDIDGLRVSKEANGETLHYLVDTNREYGQVLEETLSDGTATVTYTHGDGLLSQDRAGTARFFHMDGHGSVVSLTDTTEQVTDNYLYDAFGVALESSGTTQNQYGYTGEQFEDDLGFIYLRARYYNPTMGRFHTKDTWPGRNSNPITLHKYLYANVDPVNMVDPSGNFSLKEISISVNVASTIGDVTLTAVNIATGNYTAVAGQAAEELAFAVFGGIYGKGINASRKALRKLGRLLEVSKGRKLKIVDRHSSSVLAENLGIVGVRNPGNSAAHHIIGSGRAAQPAKNILTSHNININSPTNGVFLPRSGDPLVGPSLHKGRHISEYVEMVNIRIIQANAKGGKDAVLDELAALKLDLLAGRFPLQRP